MCLLKQAILASFFNKFMVSIEKTDLNTGLEKSHFRK